MKRREILAVVPLVFAGLPSLAVTEAKPQLLEFWASWCAVCRSMEPTMSVLKQHWGNQVEMHTVDVDNPKNAALLRKYKVFGTATFVLLDRMGKEVFRDSGQIPQVVFETELKKVSQKSA